MGDSPLGTLVSRPHTPSGFATDRCGRAARGRQDAPLPRAPVADLRDRLPPLDQPGIVHARRPAGGRAPAARVAASTPVARPGASASPASFRSSSGFGGRRDAGAAAREAAIAAVHSWFPDRASFV